LNLKQQ